MAGDWLKVESATPDKPEVYVIAQAFGIDPDAAFGKLFRVWAWFDQNTEEGNAPSVTKMIIDRMTGVTGFADEMIKAGWLTEADGTISMPKFDRHNGQSAKKRALTAKRVADHKKKGNAEGNAPSVTNALPREEKRREEVKQDKPPCAPAPKDETPIAIAITLNDKTEYGVTEEQIAEWAALFPAVDVMQSLRTMRAWCDANPTKRKTVRGVKKFITGWLSREQDKGGNKQGGEPQPQQSAWHETATGICEQGKRHGLTEDQFSSFYQFKQAVFAAEGIAA